MSEPVDPLSVAWKGSQALTQVGVVHTLGGSLAASFHVDRLVAALTSDRQWRDIQGIIRVQGARLDFEYLRAHAPALRVGDLLAKALTEGGLV